MLSTDPAPLALRNLHTVLFSVRPPSVAESDEEALRRPLAIGGYSLSSDDPTPGSLIVFQSSRVTRPQDASKSSLPCVTADCFWICWHGSLVGTSRSICSSSFPAQSAIQRGFRPRSGQDWFRRVWSYCWWWWKIIFIKIPCDKFSRNLRIENTRERKLFKTSKIERISSAACSEITNSESILSRSWHTEQLRHFYVLHQVSIISSSR